MDHWILERLADKSSASFLEASSAQIHATCNAVQHLAAMHHKHAACEVCRLACWVPAGQLCCGGSCQSLMAQCIAVGVGSCRLMETYNRIPCCLDTCRPAESWVPPL